MDSVPATGGTRWIPQTAFERRLLPALASWFAERVRHNSPDYLIPVETKGARLLEAVITYARERLGTPIEVPVIYSTALPYLPRGALQNAHVMIVDDAWRTGNNLQRHRRRIEEYGASEVDTVVCVGYPETEPEDPAVWCFQRVPSEAHYQELLWQIAELVMARELPPEVDHHVFELTVPQRLPLALATLESVLPHYGELTVDAPPAAAEATFGLTLHFPTLPGLRKLPGDGEARSEGVNKLRFFPDPRTGDIYVVPVSFPALDLHADQDRLAPEAARALVDGWTGGEDPLGHLLLDSPSAVGAEIVFRTISACTELDLVRGLARVLASTYRSGSVRLAGRRELFQRLYGEHVGERVASLIDGELARALENPCAELSIAADTHLPWPRRTLDEDVARTTTQIANGLADLYRTRSQDPEHEPGQRVGRSLSEIKESLSGASDLLVSRCIDRGLALTTFVPYVNSERADGMLRVRRQYRVSEIHRDYEKPHDNIEDVRQEVSEETVALIARFMRTRTQRFAERPIPLGILTWLVAILRVLVLKDQGIELSVAEGARGSVVQLRGGINPVTLAEATSDMFRFEHDGVLPTENFEKLYTTNDRLHLDLRDSAVEVEARLDLLVGLIDADLTEPKLEAALAGWAMSTDERLGLTYVLADLDESLSLQQGRLKLVLRDEEHAGSAADYELSRAHAEKARATLAQLVDDWQKLVHRGWPRPSKLERSVLRSIAAPKDAVGIFDLADGLAQLVISLSRVVQRLEGASAGLWASGQDGDGTRADAGEHAREAVREVRSCCADVRLTLLGDRRLAGPRPEGTGARAELKAVAGELLEVTKVLGTFAAAVAGVYRGTRGQRAPVQLPPEREATVLFVDITKSVERALRDGFEVTANWKNSGLNLAAQWAKAFGGREVQDRPGDAVWLDFGQHPDAAVMCAGAIQQHMRALRLTGLQSLSWTMHMAVDEGRLRDADGGCVAGDCIDRSARCAKVEYDGKRDDGVLVTQETATRCSADLRENGVMSELPQEIELAGEDLPGSRITPFSVDSKRVLRVLRNRVHALTERLLPQVEAPEEEPLLASAEADKEQLGDVADV
jgi:hypothetical protein